MAVQLGAVAQHLAHFAANVIERGILESTATHDRQVEPVESSLHELEAREAPAAESTERLRKLGARTLLLKVTKNRVGSTGEVPLSFIPGAATVEESRP